MKTDSFAAIKKDEARRRMTALRPVRSSDLSAEERQRRAGLVDGSKGRITNLPKVMRAMTKWAKSS